MDEEDLNEQEEARVLQTAGAYAGLGLTDDDARRRDALIDLMRPAASIGVTLLQKMGWREGQGIGPKVRRRARLGAEDADDRQEAHLFAPQNTKMITFTLKTDTKGLGFGGQSTAKASHDEHQEDDDAGLLAQSKSKFGQQSKPSKKSSFGLGVLNDTGSDDEDPYEVGPKISYNKSLAARKRKKTKPAASSTANPLVSTKPIFLSKKKLSTGFRKTHDGRLPLDGFLLTTAPLDLATASRYPPPKVPPDWKSSKGSTGQEPKKQYQSTADAARASTLDPAARASLLGEATLPGKSVFDFLPAAARARLVAASGKTDLPAARGESAPSTPSSAGKPPAAPAGGGGLEAAPLPPPPLLDAPTARAALARIAPAGGGGGWSPYADDAGKRARYRAFLEAAARGSGAAAAGGPAGERGREEAREFAQAARVFRPMSGAMAQRFTPSSSSASAANPASAAAAAGENAAPSDPAEDAARMGMFGVMTRAVRDFAPTRLVCKRFGVRPPDSAVADEREAAAAAAAARTSAAGGGESLVDQIMREAGAARMALVPTGGCASGGGESAGKTGGEVDRERNEALEKERPGDAVFKAIFGSDDDSDD